MAQLEGVHAERSTAFIKLTSLQESQPAGRRRTGDDGSRRGERMHDTACRVPSLYSFTSTTSDITHSSSVIHSGSEFPLY